MTKKKRRKHDWGGERETESNKRLPASHARRGSVWMRLTFWHTHARPKKKREKGFLFVIPSIFLRSTSLHLVKQFLFPFSLKKKKGTRRKKWRESNQMTLTFDISPERISSEKKQKHRVTFTYTMCV